MGYLGPKGPGTGMVSWCQNQNSSPWSQVRDNYTHANKATAVPKASLISAKNILVLFNNTAYMLAVARSARQVPAAQKKAPTVKANIRGQMAEPHGAATATSAISA